MLQNRGRLLGCAAGGLVALLVLAGIFWIGLHVGEARARLLGGPLPIEHGFVRSPWGRDFLKSHGAMGEIQSLAPGAFVIKGRGGVERRIYVQNETIIARGSQRIVFTDLQAGEQIIAIGSVRENGDLDARVIRVWIRGK